MPIFNYGDSDKAGVASLTAEGWRYVIWNALFRYWDSDLALLNSLAQLLAEQDAAKALLCERFACIGRPWPDLVPDICNAFDERSEQHKA